MSIVKSLNSTYDADVTKTQVIMALTLRDDLTDNPPLRSLQIHITNENGQEISLFENGSSIIKKNGFIILARVNRLPEIFEIVITSLNYWERKISIKKIPMLR